MAERSTTRATPSLRLTGLEAGDPEARGLVVLLGFLLLVALERFVVGVLRLLAVAVVRLVVDREDVLHAHQVGHDPLEHLAFGLQRVQVISTPAFEQRATTRRELDALAQLEGVVVGDDDLGLVEVVEHVARDELAAGVVAVGVVGLQDAQAVLDGEAGRDDRGSRAVNCLLPGAAHGVDRLPGDQHRHHGGLAGAGGELQRQAQLGVGVALAFSRCSRNSLAADLLGARPR